MDIFFVYVLFRLDTGQPCYIGKGKGKRHTEHLKLRKKYANKHLKGIVASCGVAPVKIRENLSEAEALATEIALIAAIGRGDNGPLVNLTDGGDGVAGRIASEEEKRGASVRSKARWADPVFKARMAMSISAGRKGIGLGVPLKPETKAKMSLVRKGRPRDEKTKIRLRNSLWINDGKSELRIIKGSSLPSGWIVGKLSKGKPWSAGTAASIIGSAWITDGETNRRLAAGGQIPDGWMLGTNRTQQKGNP